MNSSNRYGIESMARQRQAEIEKQLRQAAELRNLRPSRPAFHVNLKWAAIGATALSLLGTIAFVVTMHAR
jgi:hypothetical protein